MYKAIQMEPQQNYIHCSGHRHESSNQQEVLLHPSK